MFGRRMDVFPGIEALLGGTYVEYLEGRGQGVPPWAWINLLAHGSEEALGRTARPAPVPILDVNMWRHARRYLAGEVLAAADRAGSLPAVQSRVLVPLELAHMTAHPSRRSRPGEWAAWVLAAIELDLSPRRSDA
jgi:hypothetical protein